MGDVQISTKKGLIAMMEMVMVAIVAMVLIILALIFFTSQKSDNTDLIESKTTRLIEDVIGLPELDCGLCGGSNEQSCFDIAKLDAFSSNTFDKSSYILVFKSSRIKVESIYPIQKNWVVYDKLGKLGFTQTQLPVLLCDPITNKNSFGLVTFDVST